METCPLSFFMTNPQLCLSSPIFWGSRRNRCTAVLSNLRPEPQRHLAQPESGLGPNSFLNIILVVGSSLHTLDLGKQGPCALGSPCTCQNVLGLLTVPGTSWIQQCHQGGGSLSLARDLLCSPLLCSTLYDPLPQHGQGQNVTLESRGRLQ